MHAASSALCHVDGPKIADTLFSLRGPGAQRDPPGLRGFERVNEQNEEQFCFNQVVFTLRQNDRLHQENSSANVSAPPSASSLFDRGEFHR